MEDFDGVDILVGDRVAFADSEGTDLVKGTVLEFGEKMVSIERDGSGWPRKVRRYPNQIMVMLKIN